jgi:hypothetical protein
MGANRDLFRQTLLQKCGRINNCSLDYGSCVSRIFEEFQHPAIQTKIVQALLADFVDQLKVCQPIGRKDSMQTVDQASRRLDLFLHEAAQNFEAFQIFITESKKI